MLPALSQATSDGRLKRRAGRARSGRSRPVRHAPTATRRRRPAPAGGVPRPPRRRRTAAGLRRQVRRDRRRRTGADVDRFRLAAEHERHAPFGVELHDLVGALVDRPDVVLRIDAQPDRGVEAVDVLSELAHELAGRVELEQPRAVAIERPVVAERRVRMAGARVDEDLSLRIRSDAADFADEDVVGRLQQVGIRIERDFRDRCLRDERRRRMPGRPPRRIL